MNQICTACIISALFLLIPANNAFTVGPSALTSPESICNATPSPAFCRIIKPMEGCSFHDIARKSFHYSFFLVERVFYRVVDNAFIRHWKWPSCVPLENRMFYAALESCDDLIRENKKILFETFQVIRCRDKLEDPSEAQCMTDLLRSVLRNHETCFDALAGAAASADDTTASEIKDMLRHRSIGSESFNATLVLFRLGWEQHIKQLQDKFIEIEAQSKQENRDQLSEMETRSILEALRLNRPSPPLMATPNCRDSKRSLLQLVSALDRADPM
nr:probable pectinesterase/pectinesterase inhibitor 20 [Ipomoea batatas]